MEKASDTYKTIAQPSEEILIKEKKSKFYGYAFPIRHEEEVKNIIENLRTKHPSANHVCYAWQIGAENPTYRANDDGEPNNTAGMPIYGQIQSFDLTNVLVAVARIFGGTKLGVGGLISAYREAAKPGLGEFYIKGRNSSKANYTMFWIRRNGHCNAVYKKTPARNRIPRNAP